jgi:D-lyxose ketol-isomerase
MTRSEINRIIRDSRAFFDQMGFRLPPAADWTTADWTTKGVEVRELVDVGIGWDITDFGRGDFDSKGLVLFTLRNGRVNDSRYPKPYAEKIMIVGEEQLTLTHYHWNKAEDIINRGGGNLVIRLHNATDDDRLADTPVIVQMDGVTRRLPCGADVVLHPGESITLTPRLYHSFWGEAGKGAVLVGEVSCVNDDQADNCFLEEQLRFPAIEEDEEPFRLLVGDYASRIRFP